MHLMKTTQHIATCYKRMNSDKQANVWQLNMRKIFQEKFENKENDWGCVILVTD